MKTILTAIISALLFSGCAATKQARDVTQSGFLGDYSKLKHSHGRDSLLTYANPEADWKAYDRIILDPVMIWRPSETDGESVVNLQRLADYMHGLVQAELSKDYTVVREPGSNTMRISIAIIKAEQSVPVLAAISSVPLPGNLLALGSLAKNMTTGKPAWVGEAVIEGKVTDSQTGVLLGAAVDRRVGGKSLSAGRMQSWGDVEEALRYWSINSRYRLCKARGAQGCAPPD
jgi:hypothetical protein